MQVTHTLGKFLQGKYLHEFNFTDREIAMAVMHSCCVYKIVIFKILKLFPESFHSLKQLHKLCYIPDYGRKGIYNFIQT